MISFKCFKQSGIKGKEKSQITKEINDKVASGMSEKAATEAVLNDKISAANQEKTTVMKAIKNVISGKKPTNPSVIKEKFGKEDKPFIKKIKDSFKAVMTKSFWEKIATKGFDKLHPVKELGEEAYRLRRIETGSGATLAMFLEHGKLKWDKSGYLTGTTRKKGVMPFLRSLGKDSGKFLYWIAAKRAEVLELQGREKLLDKQARDEIFEWAGGRNNPEFIKAAPKLKDFNSNILDIAEDAGLIDPESRKTWEQDYYVPFYRIMEDENARSEFLKAPRKNSRFISAQIKRLKGHEARSGDPLENLIRNWQHLIHESMRNVARKEAYKFGIETDSGIVENAKPSDIVSFKPSKKDEKIIFVHKKDNVPVLMFQEKGKPVYFKVNDPDVFYALQDNSEFSGFVGKLLRPATWAKHAITYGATFGPAFRVANLIRDTLHTAAIDKSFKPFIDSAKGLVKAWRQDQDFVDLMSSGAGFGSSYIRADDPKATAKAIKRIISKEGKGAAKTILDTPKKMLDFWERVGAASENAARVQLYSKLMKEGVSHKEAAFKARDLLDFTMRGESRAVQVLIQTIPFLNARMQALYKLGRAATSKENRRNFRVRGGMLAAASMLLWGLYRDDERYKELEDWDKWTYYHFWIGDQHFRIPKPFEVGAIFSSLPEAMLNSLYGNEKTKHIADFFLHTATENFAIGIPQLFKPIAEQWANKSFFTGRKIVGERLEGLMPEEQYDPWTSEFLRVTAGKMGISPKRAESVIRGYMGTFGMFLLAGADIITHNLFDFPESPNKKIDDYPLIGRFMKGSPPRHTKYMTEFYKLFNKMDELVKTINRKRELGDRKGVKKLKQKNVKIYSMQGQLKRTQRQLAFINKRMRKIYESKDLTAKQKRKKIDELTIKKNRYVKRIYNIYYNKKR